MTSHSARATVHLTVSAALTLSIFALPVWTLTRSVPMPIETFEASSVDHRIATWTTEVALAAPSPDERVPEPEPKQSDRAEATEEVKVATEEPTRATSADPDRATAVLPKLPAPTATPAPIASAEAATVEAPAASPAEHGAATPKESVATRSDRRRRRPQKDCRPDVPQIRATGTARWEIDRSLVDHYARNLDEANRLAYVSWARDEEGQVIGFKVKRVRCGSPLHEAGFQSGDVVTQINGRKVRTVPQALAAYVALRIKRKLHIRGIRSGQRLDLRYRLT
ncbi:MAG: hypothetical protein CL927_01570 [Deltaproteobacteria bacterium]|nr:hypothetical protein [Deltaproteobacteria bacterium]HCH65166.1 hypothetical protein [Deltaproteobacteria bacterium]